MTVPLSLSDIGFQDLLSLCLLRRGLPSLDYCFFYFRTASGLHFLFICTSFRSSGRFLGLPSSGHLFQSASARSVSLIGCSKGFGSKPVTRLFSIFVLCLDNEFLFFFLVGCSCTIIRLLLRQGGFHGQGSIMIGCVPTNLGSLLLVSIPVRPSIVETSPHLSSCIVVSGCLSYNLFASLSSDIRASPSSSCRSLLLLSRCWSTLRVLLLLVLTSQRFGIVLPSVSFSFFLYLVW